LKISNLEELTNQVLSKNALWLFLDYDGTLAEFAPTPEIIDPNPQIADLLIRLATKPNARVAIISGRRLRDVQSLIPVPGIYLAGTYGIELITPDGEHIQRTELKDIRTHLDMVKPKWVELIADETGFFLEDKDWALALHARFSADADAKRILALAREVVDRKLPEEKFRILGGHKFLEAAPLHAHKGQTVAYLLDKNPMPDSQLLYIGDDDKDEEAFDVIQTHRGVAVRVLKNMQSTQITKADYILDSTNAVNSWLETLCNKL